MEVFWPTTGITQTIHDLGTDQMIEIVEGREGYRSLSYPRTGS